MDRRQQSLQREQGERQLIEWMQFLLFETGHVTMKSLSRYSHD